MILLKLKKKFQSLDSLSSSSNILPNWFALVKETSFRTIGLRPYDNQLLAGFYSNSLYSY